MATSGAFFSKSTRESGHHMCQSSLSLSFVPTPENIIDSSAWGIFTGFLFAETRDFTERSIMPMAALQQRGVSSQIPIVLYQLHVVYLTFIRENSSASLVHYPIIKYLTLDIYKEKRFISTHFPEVQDQGVTYGNNLPPVWVPEWLMVRDMQCSHECPIFHSSLIVGIHLDDPV